MTRDWGIAAGDRVMLVYEPGLESFIALVACFKTGAVAAVAYPPSPTFGGPGREATALLTRLPDGDPRSGAGPWLAGKGQSTFFIKTDAEGEAPPATQDLLSKSCRHSHGPLFRLCRRPRRRYSVTPWRHVSSPISCCPYS